MAVSNQGARPGPGVREPMTVTVLVMVTYRPAPASARLATLAWRRSTGRLRSTRTPRTDPPLCETLDDMPDRDPQQGTRKAGTNAAGRRGGPRSGDEQGFRRRKVASMVLPTLGDAMSGPRPERVCPYCAGRFRRLDRHLAGRGACGVAEAGEWQTDRYGRTVPHAGVQVARSSRLAMARLLRELHLDLGEETPT